MKIILFLFLSFVSFGQQRYVIIGKFSNVADVPLKNLQNFQEIIPGHYITDENSLKDVVDYDYKSPLKEINGHFSYTSNELLIRTNKIQLNDLNLLSKYGMIKVNDYNPTLLTINLEVKDESTAQFIKEQIEKFDFVKHAQLNQYFNLSVTSNDPLYPNQWYLENNGTSIQNNGIVGADIDVVAAWDMAKGDSIIVAVMDSGVDTLHEEFQGRLLPGLDAFATDSINTHGYPFTDYNDNAHGTSCAGIIGAEQDNNLGISGVAPHVSIVPVRMFFYINFNGQIVPFTNMNALVTASAYSWNYSHADVISCSAGLTDEYITLLTIDTSICNQELRMAYENGRNGKGTIMLFSAGNDNIPTVLWPANLKETIAVGASDMCDKRKRPNDCSGENWWGSSYGQTLDLVAPGVKIATCDISGNIGFSTGDYTLTFNGTSAACPVAAGVTALLLDYNPELTVSEVKHILNFTAEKVVPYVYDSLTTDGSWNEEVGHGRINAHLALLQAFSASNEFLAQNSSAVFPNPAHDQLCISDGTGVSNQIAVYNINGEKVKLVQTNLINDITELSNGVYFVDVKHTRFRFIILH